VTSSERPFDAPKPREVFPDIPPSETGPGPGRRSSQRLFGALPKWLVAMFLAIAIVAPSGYLIHIPYYSVGPGPSVDVLSIIDVRGARTYPSKGKLLLTTASVSVNTLNLWSALYAWLDPSVALVPRTQVVTPGVTDKEQDIENQLEMDESKFAAELVAFRALNLPIVKIAGARVLSVVAGKPADGRLRAHDLIVSINRHRVTGIKDAFDQFAKVKAGQLVRIGFIRDGAPHAVTLKTVQASAADHRAVIGIEMTAAYKLPHDVELDTQQIVGPSGGLLFTLAIYDAFTPADLTKGHIIAGTGEIGFDRNGIAVVGPIGAIEEKVRTANAAGADVFLAPASQAAAARKVAPKSMKVIGVTTFADALRALHRLKAAA
jgi:PDZ domain-containing protein